MDGGEFRIIQLSLVILFVIWLIELLVVLLIWIWFICMHLFRFPQLAKFKLKWLISKFLVYFLCRLSLRRCGGLVDAYDVIHSFSFFVEVYIVKVDWLWLLLLLLLVHFYFVVVVGVGFWFVTVLFLLLFSLLSLFVNVLLERYCTR